MKVSYKLTLSYIAIALLVATVGIIGYYATTRISASYEGQDDQFRLTSMTASKISSQAKIAESQLLLYLSFHNESHKNRFESGIAKLREEVDLLHSFSRLNSNTDFIYKLYRGLDEIYSIGYMLIRQHDVDMRESSLFSMSLHEQEIRHFHNASSSVRKLGVALTQYATAFLNKQHAITTAAEISSYAKRAEGHLMLYLTLNSEKDLNKYYKRYDFLKNLINQLELKQHSPSSGEFISNIKTTFVKLAPLSSSIIATSKKLYITSPNNVMATLEPKVLAMHAVISDLRYNSDNLAQVSINWEAQKAELAQAEATQIQFFIIALTIISFVLALAIGFLLSNSIRSPLKKLTQAAELLSSGDLGVQIEVPSKDEIGQLADSFNKMSKNLRSAHGELLRQKDVAEHANNVKTDFLSKVSHELRTPLNAVLGYSQLLCEEDLSKQQKNDLGKIDKAGRHLLDLVDDILDLSKIEHDSLALTLENVEITTIITECLDIIRPSIQSSQNTLDTRFPDGEAIYVHADPTRLKQVLINLLSNAVKYNTVGGQVLVNLEVQSAETIRIEVQDQGLGLDELQMERVFKPFERVGKDQNKVDGLGIGLSISKYLIESMHGTIGINSKPGKGSTFWLDLKILDIQHQESLRPEITKQNIVA